MKKLALAFLILFVSTYLCEALFSYINFIKSRTRNCVGADMSTACVKLKTTKYKPRITEVAEKMQQQVFY